MILTCSFMKPQKNSKGKILSRGNNCVIGHIEGFCESYQKALRIYGYDED